MDVKKTSGLSFSIISRVLLLFSIFLLLISWTVLKITENAVLKEQIKNLDTIVQITAGSIHNLEQTKKELDIEELVDWILKPVKQKKLLLNVIVYDNWQPVYSDESGLNILIEKNKFIATGKNENYFINYKKNYLSLSNYKWIDYFYKVNDRYTIFMRFDISWLPKTLYSVYKLIFLYIILTAIIIFFVLVMFIQKRIINPINELNIFAEKVGKGIFSKKSPYKKNDEIGFLSKSMVEMSKNIKNDRKVITQQIKDLDEAYNRLKEMQDEIIKSEKFALIGQMTSGLAHEIGNPITSITGFSQLLLNSNEIPEKDKDLIKRILSEGRRIDKLIKELLSFSKPKKEELTKTDLNKLVEKAVDLLTHQGRFKLINLSMDLKQINLCTEENKLLQVFINLLINATDAIEERWGKQKGGEINIKIEEKTENNRLLILIKDNGIGIDQEDLKKIFLPFYTSKDPGKGNGLGLYVCSNIIDQINGKIEVESSQNIGTIFKIYLHFNEELC